VSLSNLLRRLVEATIMVRSRLFKQPASQLASHHHGAAHVYQGSHELGCLNERLCSVTDALDTELANNNNNNNSFIGVTITLE
jgi:hypothetical protein